MAEFPHGINAGIPAQHAEAVNISTTNHTFTEATKAVYVGGTGDLVVTMAQSGTAVKISCVQAGTLLAISVKSIVKLGTTATAITGFW